MVKKAPARNRAGNPDFTFKDLNRAGIRFNSKAFIEVEYEADTENVTITKTDEIGETVKTIESNFDNPGGGAELGTKTITENGTYNASADELDGYSSVTVNVPTGGTNRETELISGSLYGSYTNNDVTIIKPAGMADCPAVTSVTMTALVSAGNNAFLNDTALETVNLPEMTATGTQAFKGCTSLNNVTLPKLLVLNNSVFENCTGLTSINLPAATECKDSCLRNCRFSTLVLPDVTKVATYSISNNANLTAVDFTSLTQMNGGSCFINDSSLSTVIIRNSTLATLSNTNHFNGTPLATDGTGGDIYVPSSLKSQYEQATNWSALNATFKAIEGSYYETHYADGSEVTP